jgi:hypothetical protein
MRDGLPVIALVVAATAFFVAVAGVIFRGPVEVPEPPEETLKAADRRLQAVEREREELRVKLARLRGDVTRAIEAGPGGSKIDRTELQNIARKAADEALRKKLQEERARVGAPAPGGAGAQPKQGPAARKAAAEPKSDLDVKFDGMLRSVEGALKLDKARAGRVRKALSDLRDRLNEVYTQHKRGGMTTAQRDLRADAARKSADRELSRVLKPAEFQKYVNWRGTTTDGYVKAFFGLK